MPKQARELKAIQVKNLSAPGLHAVGGVSGLNLSITEAGARSWILRSTVQGKRRHIGLGPYPEVSLAEAREQAAEMRRRIRAGRDPVEERRAERAARAVEVREETTFETAFLRYFEEKVQIERSNPKHVKQWKSTIVTYAFPVIKDKPVSSISMEDILAVLSPIWSTKNETASRVRQRVEAVLDWSRAMGFREGDNPARWKGNLQQVLPAPSKIQKTGRRQPAIALDEAADWFGALQSRKGMAALALQFLTLTASRSGELRGATWEEIDLAKKIWIIPAERMKVAREHRVPLSSAAVDLLKVLPRYPECNYVFPSPRAKQMSDMAISAVMRRMQADDVKAGRAGFLDPQSRSPAVPHGIRSTFRDWAAERTNYPREMAEIALAHTVGSDVERAYRRGDMVEKRREMMEDWARFVCGSSEKG
ncbi:integrase [Roseovarius sp. TE539]|uniref:tyrosine-type recombinase/integrase n=1 Tax=Roseovarius sp. TE539 TaxID=2249812 RepID=UPI000DDEFE9A|nr:site-specific integrase [Roseovarius sp. TE539]RBI67857.1 integrase [Roseovarius sp. TE539]